MTVDAESRDPDPASATTSPVPPGTRSDTASGTPSGTTPGERSADPSADAAARPTAYGLLGGEPAVRALVDRFYDLMDLEPTYAGLRALHPPSLDGSRDKLYWFLCGWLGGPDHFVERFGHPRLRARHLPFRIGIAERDQWMGCMRQAMADVAVEPRLAARLDAALAGTADWMRNVGG